MAGVSILITAPALYALKGGNPRPFMNEFQRASQRLFDELDAALASAKDGISDAATAADSAQTADQKAVTADQKAVVADQKAVAAQTTADTVSQDLATHVTVQATEAILGHVRRAATPVLAMTGPGTAGAAYDPADLQQTNDALDSVIARVNELEANLRAAGLLA